MGHCPVIGQGFLARWESLLTSYPPGEAEVYESEAGVGIGFAFEVGARGPAEGGGAGPRAPRKIRSP